MAKRASSLRKRKSVAARNSAAEEQDVAYSCQASTVAPRYAFCCQAVLVGSWILGLLDRRPPEEFNPFAHDDTCHAIQEAWHQSSVRTRACDISASLLRPASSPRVLSCALGGRLHDD
ncbi:hypothetical protein BP6252_08032 [Coleophoma cylindrospora]|uniref:Uncharacterized protein n=1 Tax=Coleophoma cylindrospora TaxID=1849047 RepID=A0A3D8RBN5_9HELO|nr:hypothetical protein BP6252_08032 [Coleophoma cylindrospora]